jgi:hypothetical protein
MAKGVKVSIEGKAVSSRTPKDILLNSLIEVPKVDLQAKPPRYGIIKFKFLAQPPDGLETLIYIIPHLLGYVPMVLIYGVDEDTFAGSGMKSVYPPPISVTGISGLNSSRITCKVDRSNLYFYVLADSSSGGTIGGRATLRYTIFSKPLKST